MAPRLLGIVPTSKAYKTVQPYILANSGGLTKSPGVRLSYFALLTEHGRISSLRIPPTEVRGDPLDPLLFRVAEHGPIWLDGHTADLAKACSMESAMFALCSFGATT